jgi:hypothetical protein
MLKSKVEELAVYEYEKNDRIKRKFRKDLELSDMFKTHLHEFENQEDGIEYNYIKRIAHVNQSEIQENHYTKEKGLRKALNQIRKFEFQEKQESEKSSRILINEFNAISGLFLKSICLSILSQNSKEIKRFGFWENEETAWKLGQNMLTKFSDDDELGRLHFCGVEEDMAFKNYFRTKIKNFEKSESNIKLSRNLVNFCQNDKNLFSKLSELQFMNISSFEYIDCNSLSYLLNFYSSTHMKSVVSAEIMLSKPSILQLDNVSRLCCFKLIQDQNSQNMFDFYNDQIDHDSMGEFVILLDELMLWIDKIEKDMEEMAGMPVFVSVKNLVLKIAKFGSECPYR